MSRMIVLRIVFLIFSSGNVLFFYLMVGHCVRANEIPVIINEALANEPGSMVFLEWIELYNRTDTIVDLSGFILVDGNDSTELAGLAINAGGFAVLARRLTGDPGQDSFESYWGDGSGVWGDGANEDYSAITAAIKLRNSADTIVLYSPAGGTSLFFWDAGADDGVSLERLRPDSPDEISSFQPSVDRTGSTPGRINSQTPRPNDLAVDTAAIVITPYPPRAGLSFSITVPVINIGMGRTAENIQKLYIDENENGIADDSEIFAEHVIPSLAAGDSASIVFIIDEPGMVGVLHIILMIGDDGNNANNIISILVKVLPDRPEIVINEFLPDPVSVGPAEWIELFNRTNDTIDITGWQIGDSIHQNVITTDIKLFAGGAYLIVCENKTAFAGTYQDVPSDIVIEIAGWRALNNSGDGIILRDNFGFVIDSVIFSSTYGGGHSIERVSAVEPAGDTANWGASVAISGATPGEINSRTPRPNDLAVEAAGINILPVSLTVNVPVINVGLGDSDENQLYFGFDDNANGMAEDHEIIRQVPIPVLAEGETEIISVPLADILWTGTKILIFTIGEDGNNANNTACFAYRLPSSLAEIIINEYMPDPSPGKSEEWIELYNRTGGEIDINNWQIGDSVGQNIIATEPMLIPGNGYFILCESQVAFEMTYPDVSPELIIELNNWRALNNSGDKIILLDGYGFVVDSLTFGDTYDGERSVERIDPALPSSDPDNWWGSVDTSGATPGRVNSTAVDYSKTLEVLVSPNPFVRGQPVEIFYSVPQQTTLTARIYDVNGREIKTLLDNRPAASGTIEWDGTDDDGQALQPGVYVLFFQTDRGIIKKIVMAVSPTD